MLKNTDEGGIIICKLEQMAKTKCDNIKKFKGYLREVIVKIRLERINIKEEITVEVFLDSSYWL